MCDVAIYHANCHSPVRGGADNVRALARACGFRDVDSRTPKGQLCERLEKHFQALGLSKDKAVVVQKALTRAIAGPGTRMNDPDLDAAIKASLMESVAQNSDKDVEDITSLLASVHLLEATKKPKSEVKYSTAESREFAEAVRRSLIQEETRLLEATKKPNPEIKYSTAESRQFEEALRRSLIQEETLPGGWKCLEKAYPDWKDIAKDCQLVVRECGGGGDCLFHSIAYAIGNNMQDVRNMAADSENIVGFVDSRVPFYLTMEPPSTRDVRFSMTHLLKGTDLNTILNLPIITARMSLADKQAMYESAGLDQYVEEFRRVVRTRGNKYQGTDSTLSMLVHGNSEIKDLGYIVLSSKPSAQRCMPIISPSTTRVIILLNIAEFHWKLVGVKSGGSVATVFPISELPKPLVDLWDAKCQTTLTAALGV